MKDYYVILKVSRDASSDDIRKAHRKMALRYHPDRSIEPDPARFREIQEAYEILGSEDKRREYNHKLESSEGDSRMTRKPVHPGPVSLWEEFGRVLPGLEEILDHMRRDFFGPTRKVESLKDLNVEFILNPEEAASGVSTQLEVPFYQECPRCSGRGGAFPFPCMKCDGKGWAWSKKLVNLSLPPGVADGTVFQVPLQRLGIEHLYLNIQVRVSPH